ncbi:hypothetical protein SAMN02745130_03181 [Thiothrix eikelboomii]|uniref:Lipoprotein n=1 Tax=Thiothrix eikelboomii TaxID=92487 RepID=A0A1T4XMJ1_9GAMM|nr:hypothetical protein SAMN02745130_03181 [Thiothrix eikelboomii]
MKYSALLKKLMPLILSLGLAGCWVMPSSAEVGAKTASEGQALKFKRKFSDNVYVNFNPRIPPYLLSFPLYCPDDSQSLTGQLLCPPST